MLDANHDHGGSVLDDPALVDKMEAHIILTWGLFQTKYLEKIQSDSPSATFDLCTRVLSEALSTALLDMKRMSDFHLPGSSPDRHKFAAFLSFWVARFRPVSVTFSGSHYTPDALLVNANFALFVFQSFLIEGVPDELSRGLVYSFHYRSVQPEILAIMAYAAERIACLEKQVPMCSVDQDSQSSTDT